MARYGKFFTENTVDAEDIIATTDGGEYTDAVLREAGFYPIVTVGDTDNPNRSVSYSLVEDEDGGHIEERFVAISTHRTISKYKLKLAIAQAGLLQQFTAMLAQVEVAPGYMGDEAFKDASTLDEDHPKFKDAVQLVKTQFGMTDEEVGRILAASVAD